MTNTFTKPRIYHRSRSVMQKLGGISDYHFRRLLSTDDFPRPVLIPGIEVEVWADDEIEAYLARQRLTETATAGEGPTP